MNSPEEVADTDRTAPDALTDVGGRESEVGRAFVALADTLVEGYDIIELLDRLVRYSVALLAAEAAAIMLVDSSGRLQAVASSSEDADLMELLQLEVEQGPCVECFDTSAAVSVPDLSEARQRWPRFVTAVAERRTYRSVHAVPLRLRGQAIGALNLFHRDPGALPAADLALAQALADVATIGILSERAVHDVQVLNAQLQTALNSRVIIEQAKGVLAVSGQLSMDAAFTALRGYARRNNLRLSEVARALAERHLGPAVVLAPAAASRPR